MPQKKEAIDTSRLMLLIQHKSRDKTHITANNKTNNKPKNITRRDNNNSKNNNNNTNQQKRDKKFFGKKRDERLREKQETKPTTKDSKNDTQTTETTNNITEKEETKTLKSGETKEKETTKETKKGEQAEKEKKEEGKDDSDTKETKSKSKKEKKNETTGEGEIITALIATPWLASQIDVVVGPDADVYADVDAMLTEEINQLPKEEIEVIVKATEAETKTEVKSNKQMCVACDGKGSAVKVNIAAKGISLFPPPPANLFCFNTYFMIRCCRNNFNNLSRVLWQRGTKEKGTKEEKGKLKRVFFFEIVILIIILFTVSRLLTFLIATRRMTTRPSVKELKIINIQLFLYNTSRAYFMGKQFSLSPIKNKELLLPALHALATTLIVVIILISLTSPAITTRLLLIRGIR